jgi:hypothetical protein
VSERETPIRRSFREQAAICESLGSPFTARLLSALEAQLDSSTEIGRAILGWQGQPGAMGDALALRVAGAFHALARSGTFPALGTIYPPAPALPNHQLRDCVAKTLRGQGAFLLPWLQFAPQTNEVARSAALYLGLMEITRRTRLPVKLLEIGASAGLNLVLDRYEYDFGGRRFGRSGSELKLAPTWEGPVPAEASPEIVARRGCDLAPLDLTRAEHRERLQAYVWADQADRQQRLASAIDLLARAPPVIDCADAADWVAGRISLETLYGHGERIVTVLMHSITFSYLPDAAKARITAHMENMGSHATSAAPLGWLALELHPDKMARLTLRLWPGGEETVLAVTDPHCRLIRPLPV